MMVFGLIVLGFVVMVLVVERQYARRLQRQLSEGTDSGAPPSRRSRWWDGGWGDGSWGWGDGGGWGGDGGGGGGGDC